MSVLNKSNLRSNKLYRHNELLRNIKYTINSYLYHNKNLMPDSI